MSSATSPQFVPSTNGGATANTVPGGTADVNLRGFGATRNLVLVNGRRFAISGPEQVTDINTIPSALIARTEIVTGGSSAVYGSDAITGVVNFIMRDDFEGVEARAQVGIDSATATLEQELRPHRRRQFRRRPRQYRRLGQLHDARRHHPRRARRLHLRFPVRRLRRPRHPASPRGAGVPLAVPAGQTCRGAGGELGFVAGGSGDIPFARISGIPLPGSAQSNPALERGLCRSRDRQFRRASASPSMPAAGTPAPRSTRRTASTSAPTIISIVPQERWMINAFSHYDFAEDITGYLEFHYSNNQVRMRSWRRAMSA